MDKIDSFIEKLSNYESKESGKNQYTNQYYGKSAAAQNCRNNLKSYLTYLYNNKPTIMLVGEAPGCHGCAKTGIPFTDECTLKKSFEYFTCDAIGNEKETSANIMWSQFKYYNQIPLMWNAFPFHPHVENSLTNRTPTKEEIENIGKQFLIKLIEIFNIEKDSVYAVGRKAQQTLLINDGRYIRHPSHGGKMECIKGLNHILNAERKIIK